MKNRERNWICFISCFLPVLCGLRSVSSLQLSSGQETSADYRSFLTFSSCLRLDIILLILSVFSVSRNLRSDLTCFSVCMFYFYGHQSLLANANFCKNSNEVVHALILSLISTVVVNSRMFPSNDVWNQSHLEYPLENSNNFDFERQTPCILDSLIELIQTFHLIMK